MEDASEGDADTAAKLKSEIDGIEYLYHIGNIGIITCVT